MKTNTSLSNSWLSAILLLATAAPLQAADGKASGTVTYQSKSGPISLSPRYAYLVKGPDPVDRQIIVRHLIVSTMDLKEHIVACRTLSCTDQKLGEGMTVDFDAGPRLNYWVTLKDQLVQYSGTAKPEVFHAKIDTATRLGGTLKFDASAASGPVVDIEFDATLIGEFGQGN